MRPIVPWTSHRTLAITWSPRRSWPESALKCVCRSDNTLSAREHAAVMASIGTPAGDAAFTVRRSSGRSPARDSFIAHPLCFRQRHESIRSGGLSRYRQTGLGRQHAGHRSVDLRHAAHGWHQGHATAMTLGWAHQKCGRLGECKAQPIQSESLSTPDCFQGAGFAHVFVVAG